MALPGLSFEIVRSSGPVLGVRADRTAILTLAQRGPVETPTLVQSHDEFVRVFGGPAEGMLGPLLAKSYFDNGGEQLVVTRFVPIGALRAKCALGVVNASSQGFQLALRTRDPGVFGNGLFAEALLSVRKRGKGQAAVVPLPDHAGDTVTFDGLVDRIFDAVADKGLPVRVVGGGADAWTRVASVTNSAGGPLFKQTVKLAAAIAPSGATVMLEVHEPTFTLKITERRRADILVPGLDLRDPASMALLLADTIVELDSPPASPPSFAELPNPDVRVRFSGGADGLDRASADLHPDAMAELRRSFERGLEALERSELPDVMVAPDLWSAVFGTKGIRRFAFDARTAIELGDEMVRSAARTSDRVVLLDPPLQADSLRPFSVSELEAWRAERAVALSDDPKNRDFVATYAPWARVVTGAVFKGDDTMIVPPSLMVAGQMALTARERGPWVATGNVALEPVIGLAQTFSISDEERLQDVGINPLRMTLPRGATIQGVRSLSWPDRRAWRFLSTRRLFDFLRRALTPIGLSYVFEGNSVATWISLRRDIERLLIDLHRQGAFAGAVPEQAFFVKVDAELNPEDARANGVLTAQVCVAPSFPLEFLVVRLIVGRGIATVTEEPPAP